MASRPVPPPGKLPKDYDKLPVPQPQATSVRKRDPKMLAIFDRTKFILAKSEDYKVIEEVGKLTGLLN